MKIVRQWLAELVDVPADVEAVAAAIALRGFEMASVEDGVIDFEITANRPDCLNHVGIAREASAIWQTPLRPPSLRRTQGLSNCLPLSLILPVRHHWCSAAGSPSSQASVIRAV